MVVCLVLEEHQPFFTNRALPIVHFHRDDHGAGIVLIGLLLIGQLSVRLELLHADDGKIHQAGILVRAVLIHLRAGILITLEGGFHRNLVVAVAEGHILQLRRKGCVAAVIGPVGIQHADLRHCGIPVNFSVEFPVEVILNQLKILKGHRKAERIVQLLQLKLRHPDKTVKNPDIRCLRIFRHQCLGFVHPGLSRIHGIDQIGFDSAELFIGNAARQNIRLRCPDNHMRIRIQKLNALNGRIRPLIKLTGKRLNGKNTCSLGDVKGLPIQVIDRRLRENAAACRLKDIIADVLHIVADQQTQIFNSLNPEESADLFQLPSCLHGIRLFLLYIDSSYITHSCCLLRGQSPDPVCNV